MRPFVAIICFVATGCFVLPERHPTNRTDDAHAGDGGGDGSGDGSNGLPHANIIFVTAGHFMLNQTFDSTGRVDSAENYCNMVAMNAPLDSPVRGHFYLGWLSADPVNIRDRLAVKNARAWMRVDGKPIAATLTDLVSGSLSNAIELDETGQAIIAGDHVMTGTDTNGYAEGGASASCPQTYVSVGDPHMSDGRWTTGNGHVGCNDTTSHMYCVGWDIADGSL